MDKAYIDFVALYSMHRAESFFVTRAKVTLNYEDVEYNYNIDERTGLRCDKTPIKELLTEYQVDQAVKAQYNILTLEF